MNESITVNAKRRGMLVDAGKRTVSIMEKCGYQLSFLRDSLAIDESLEKYLEIRSQFAEFHETGNNLLANHKVAAFYVWTLTNYEAKQFFLFDASTPQNCYRVTLVTFMYFVIYGILEIDRHDMDESLQEDLECCLLKELPSNLEWLCLTMHAICRYRGNPTNINE